MDDSVARDGSTAVNRFFAAEGSEPSARLADEHGGRADIIGLNARVDHCIGASQQDLPITVEIGAAARDVAGVGQAKERVSDPRHRELLKPAMGHRRVGKRTDLGHLNWLAVVGRALALHPDEEVVCSRHVRDADDGNAVRLDAQEHRPGRPAADEGAGAIDRIDDEAEPGAAFENAGFFAEEAGVGKGRDDVITNDLLRFAIGDRHRAAIRLLLGDHALLKMLQRSFACSARNVLQRVQSVRSADTSDVERFAHERSMTPGFQRFQLTAPASVSTIAPMAQRGSIVPFAGWRRTRLLGESPLRQAVRSIGDRAVRFAEEVVGQDLDARIAGIKTHPNEVGHDPFGFDPETSRYALAVAALLHRRYFRTEVFGIDRVPQGRVLIVANHSGQLPVDAVMIGSAMMLDADPPRFPRSMVETWTAELPFISTLYPRLGQVVGSPENARRLLRQEESLIVFPEGARGISKTFDQRYNLTDFGLGFVRLALETNTPIVPVAVIGGEEQYPSIADFKPLARLLRMPAFPVMPQVFFGMLAPLPTKYRLYFGDAFHFEGDPDDDDSKIEEKVWLVKSTIQSMVNRGLRERKGVFI